MMLTRCPACQTVFRLRPEQLHARRGEVRCGHCFHPFNALEHALDTSAATPDHTAPAAGATPPPWPAPPAPGLERAAPRPEAADFFVLEEKPRPPPSAGATLDFEIPDFPPPDEPWRPSVPERPSAPSGPEASGRPAEPERLEASERPVLPGRREIPAQPDSFERPGFTSQTAPSEAATSATHEETAFTPAAMPGVLRSGRRAVSVPPQPDTATAATPGRAPEAAPSDGPAPEAAPEPAPDIARLDAAYGRPKRAAHPAARALASLVLLLMLGLLGVQLGYLYRMEIARELPGLRPLFVAACAQLGCTVPYPRDADRIAIDASELQSEPGRPGFYLLDATLNNRADYPQHWPHLELTLTDAGDKPISRRVLEPADWLPNTQSAEAFAPRSAVGVGIPFEAPGLAPTGYRIYIFYP